MRAHPPRAETAHNIKVYLQRVKSKACSGCQNTNDKPFEEITKHDILSYFNSFCKPTSVDQQHKWIGSFNNRLRYYAKFFRWLYNKEERPTSEENQPT